MEKLTQLIENIEKTTPKEWSENSEKIKKIREEISNLNSKELESLKKNSGYLSNLYNVKQLTYKLIGNSIYGYLGNQYCRLYSPDIAESITIQGQELVKITQDYVEQELGIPVLYGDSVSSDTIINTKENGEMEIKYLFENVDYKNPIGKEYNYLKNISVLTLKNGTSIYRPVKYIMRHKCNKKMYRIHHEYGYIDITEDHSLMGVKKYRMFDSILFPRKLSIKELKEQNHDLIYFDNKLSYIPIKKIEEIEYDGYVYDIEVEDTHTFFANGILAHNTDSLFILIDKVIPDKVKEKGDEEVKKFINKYVEEEIYPKLNNVFDNLAKQINTTEHWFNFKQEIIAKRALFLKARDEKKAFAKKRYILHIIDQEGVPKDEIDAKGIELKRSELPKMVKDFLWVWVENFVKENKPENELIKDLMDFKSQIKEYCDKKEIDDICIYKSMSKSVDEYEKTSPEVRGAKLWNLIAKPLKLPKIDSGVKLRILYIKPKSDIKNVKDKKLYEYILRNKVDTISIPTDISKYHVPDSIWDILEINLNETYRKLLYDSVEIYMEMMGCTVDRIKYNRDNLINIL